MSLPVGVFELVLHIEQPNPDRAADEEHRPLHERDAQLALT
jgi:hypothetical protein